MKLEKREITLNEKDSLYDVLFMQKTLLNGYLSAMEKAQRKETQTTLLSLIGAACEDLYFIKTLLTDLSEDR